MRVWLGVWCVAVVLGAAPAYAVEEIIDDFNDAHLPGSLLCAPTAPNPDCPANTFNLGVFAANSSNSVTDTGLAGAIGGSRGLTVSVTTCSFCGMGQFDDRVVAGAEEGPMGLFCYNSTPSADGSFELLYDAAGAGLNASLIFAAGIRMLVANIDAASFPFSVTVPTDLILDFAYSSFTGIDGVDLSNISSIRVLVDPSTAADLQIQRIATYGTPEMETACDDGLDDDNDGLVDCRDPDCVGYSRNCVALAPALSSAATVGLLGLLASIGGLGILRLRRRDI
jgi:hypothetical protein